MRVREEKCKFSHDVDAYVKSKAPDLPGTCVRQQRGGCPYGVKCRYLGSHDGNAKEAEGGTVALEPPKTVVAEMNFFDRDVMKRLRRRTIFLARIPSYEMCWGRRRRMVAVMTPAATTRGRARRNARKKGRRVHGHGRVHEDATVRKADRFQG